MMQSSLQIASVLAVSLLGGIFVPLDYEQPIARQKNILRNLNPKVILLNSENKELQGDCVANTINLLQDNLEKQKIYVNSDNKVSDYAYVIYTSGTTGQPKGVVMSHKAVANTIDGINERYYISGVYESEIRKNRQRYAMPGSINIIKSYNSHSKAEIKSDTMQGFSIMLFPEYFSTEEVQLYMRAFGVDIFAVIDYMNKIADSASIIPDIKLLHIAYELLEYTLKWYRSCWPFMAIYQSFLPYTLLFALPVGSILVMKGIVGVAPFILALCLALGLGAPLLRTISFMSVVPQIRYKIEELEKVLDSPPVKEGQNFYQGKSYDICFEHVFFRYDEKEVLHDINLNIKTNTKVALVGESGAGKSTLAKLLIHYYDVNNGKIMIGNQNICDMRLEALNELIAYVSQDNFLFNMSLMENIRIGKPTASDEEVVAAAKKAQCMDFINRLSEGIYTKAGDSGNKLSGGERQRITLARAILKDAPIIVLDEATAFTDSENEIKIESVLSELVKHKTLIVIAHRLTTIVNAQQICILDKGNLVDCGTHKELLEKCEIYRNLWKANQDSTQWQIGGKTE